jgi:peptidyl-Lys metalloendopeptidase
MQHFNRFCVLFCILTAALALGACTPESPSAVVEPTEMTQPSQIGLEAVLQVLSTLPDGDSVELEFTLINHSETGLYVLKWYTPLEGLAGEIFRIERDGQPIPYQGILATRITPPPEAYVLLEPGEALSAEVDLATAYDFSKSGEYTIEFLSPSISHVARTEAEMAKTLNDLGPVQIPSKRVSVTIASASDLSVRWAPAEAAEMIRGYLQSQKPDLNPDFRLPLEELPMHEAWEYMRVQVFRITEGTFVNESFLIRGDSVLSMGTAVGGRGLTSLEISDLDRDGSAELLFTYGFGSGIHQSRIGMYAPAYGKNRIYEAETAYLGDLSLFKEDMFAVGVRVVESDDATLTLRYLDTLGHLAIEQHNGQVELVLLVAEDLPD